MVFRYLEDATRIYIEKNQIPGEREEYWAELFETPMHIGYYSKNPLERLVLDKIKNNLHYSALDGRGRLRSGELSLVDSCRLGRYIQLDDQIEYNPETKELRLKDETEIV